MWKNCRAFATVLAIKTLVELLARFSDNSYLTGSPLLAAIGTASTVALAIPISRLMIAEKDNYVAAAVVVAVFISTYVGAVELDIRKSETTKEQNR